MYCTLQYQNEGPPVCVHSARAAIQHSGFEIELICRFGEHGGLDDAVNHDGQAYVSGQRRGQYHSLTCRPVIEGRELDMRDFVWLVG
jgi:hypothetical protein